MVQSAHNSVCGNNIVIDLYIEILSVTTIWQFEVIEVLSTHCIIAVDYMRDKNVSLDFFRKVCLLIGPRTLVKSSHPLFLLIYRQMVLLKMRKGSLRSLWRSLGTFCQKCRGSLMAPRMRLIRVMQRLL